MANGKSTETVGRPRKRVSAEPSFHSGTFGDAPLVAHVGKHETLPALPDPAMRGGSDLPPKSKMTPKQLQHHVRHGAPGEERIAVRFILSSPSDSDGIRHYDESLPLSLVRAILDPEVIDFFIPIEGTGRMKPPRTKGHFLHTNAIREMVLLDPLPEEEGE